jgi:imidazolonepropionase-like amidohydrolase
MPGVHDTIRVRGWSVRDSAPVDLVSDQGRWAAEPGRAVEFVAEGWVLPGLVDVHTHPGAEEPGQPLDDRVLRDDLTRHMDAGVLAVRCPGLAGDPPDWFGQESGLPRGFHAGPWLARPGQFFDGWGRRVADEDFAQVAAAQAAATGWCKVIGDWRVGDEPVPEAVLVRIVDAVHAVGGRVAVHSQHAAGGAAAVRAGVDSLEHGMCLDWGLLDTMKAHGTTLVPTLAVLCESLEQMRDAPPSPRREWYLDGAARHPGLVAAAHQAGVRVLAGTDSHPCGTIAAEVRALASAGMPADAAIGAASWDARDFLGLDGLAPGAEADAVVYDADPRQDLSMLDHPAWVISRGTLTRPRN